MRSTLVKAGWVVASRVALIAIRLGRNILLARLLGPLERGALSAIVAMAELCATLIGLGSPIGAAHAAANADAARPPLGSLGLIALAFAAALFGATYFLTMDGGVFHDFADLVRPLALAISVGAAFFYLRNIGHYILVGQERIAASNWLRLAESAGLLILFLAFLGFSASRFEAAIHSWLLAYVLIALITGWLIVKKAKSVPPFNQQTVAGTLSFGLKSYPGDAAQIIISRADMLIISAFAGAAAAGFYIVARVAAEMLLIVSEALAMASTRKMLKKSPNEKSAAETVDLIRLSLYLSGALALFLILTGEFWIRLAFGREYLPAMSAIVWLAPGMCLFGAANLARLDLTGRGFGGLVSLTNAACALLSVAANLTLVPHLGFAGAAMASVTVSAVLAGVNLTHLSIRTRVSIGRFFWAGRADLERLQYLGAAIAERAGRKIRR